MKLKFQKTESGNITAHILKDKDMADFSYVQMIAALMEGQSIDCEFDGLSPEEEAQIVKLRDDIWKKIYPEENGEIKLFPNV